MHFTPAHVPGLCRNLSIHIVSTHPPRSCRRASTEQSIDQLWQACEANKPKTMHRIRVTHLLEKILPVDARRLCGSVCRDAAGARGPLHAVHCRCAAAGVAGRHRVFVALRSDGRAVHAVRHASRAARDTGLLGRRRVIVHEVRLIQGVCVRGVRHRRRHRVPVCTGV